MSVLRSDAGSNLESLIEQAFTGNYMQLQGLIVQEAVMQIFCCPTPNAGQLQHGATMMSHGDFAGQLQDGFWQSAKRSDLSEIDTDFTVEQRHRLGRRLAITAMGDNSRHE